MNFERNERPRKYSPGYNRDQQEPNQDQEGGYSKKPEFGKDDDRQFPPREGGYAPREGGYRPRSEGGYTPRGGGMNPGSEGPNFNH